MIKQTDLSLSPQLYQSLPAYEDAGQNVPVAIEADGMFLSDIFRDVNRLREAEKVALADNSVTAELPAPLVRYMGCDPRVQRIVLQ